MKINFNVEFKNLKGELLKDRDNRVLKLYDVCTNALLFNDEKENIEGKEKVRRFKLAQKIYGTKELVSIEVENVALLKELITRIYSTLVVGQAWEMLESDKGD